MNEKVIEKMMTEPILVFPPTPTDSLGDSTSAEPISLLGYVVEMNQIVIGTDGKEELSGTQVYLTGNDTLKVDVKAKVTCLDRFKQRIIKRGLYRKGNSIPDVGVLYLP